MGSDWTEPRHPAKKGKKTRETIADRKEAERRRKEEKEVGKGGEGGGGGWRMEDHFEYIVEAVRIVPPEGTRQLNVRCSRH